MRNIVEGLRAVPAEVKDAAARHGLHPRRRLFAVELPLALPAIIAGLRVATVSTMSLVSVAAPSASAASGFIFYHGYQPRSPERDLGRHRRRRSCWRWCSTSLIVLGGRALTPWARKRAARDEHLLGDTWDWFTDSVELDAAPTASRHRLWEHIQYSVIALAIAVAIALPIGLVIGHIRAALVVGRRHQRRASRHPHPRASSCCCSASQPVTVWPAIVALVVLAIPPILANTFVGIGASTRPCATPPRAWACGPRRALRRRGAARRCR